MESAGLLTRTRDPDNRRVHLVELTESGTAMFDRLRDTVVAFDHRLRGGITEREMAALRNVLGRLRSNISAEEA
jgi:MarR family transcriptional regulator for hemolysin